MSRNAYTKSQIFLLEFIIVVLFFSICVTVCVLAFVKADGISVDSRQRNMAIVAMQSVAECIKSIEVKPGELNPVNESIDLLEEHFGAKIDEKQGTADTINCVVYYDKVFERTTKADAVHTMNIGIHFKDKMLTADISTGYSDPLIVKKYISVEE